MKNFRVPKDLVIVDLEATCWNRAAPEGTENISEIIEIGAVRVSLETGEPSTQFNLIEDSNEFGVFCKPEFSDTLSEFCTRLTSITDDMLKSASSFTRAIADFHSFRFQDSGNVILGSWGKYDEDMLRKECWRVGYPYPFSHAHMNIKNEAVSFFRLEKR